VCLALKRPRSKTTTRVKKLHNTQRIKSFNMVVVSVEFSQNSNRARDRVSEWVTSQDVTHSHPKMWQRNPKMWIFHRLETNQWAIYKITDDDIVPPLTFATSRSQWRRRRPGNRQIWIEWFLKNWWNYWTCSL